MGKRLLMLFMAIYMAVLPGCVAKTISVEEQQPLLEQSNKNKSEQAEETVPKKGGTLTIPLVQPDVFNPLMTKSKDMVNFLGLIFEGVMRYDQNQKPQPCLAESYEVSEDGTIWTFHLRKGVKWHDGTPFTSQDVKFTFDILRSGTLNSFYQNGIYANTYIQDLVPKDDYTICLNLNFPISNALDIMTFPVIPKAVYESVLPGAGIENIVPIGTGKYKMESTISIEDGEIRLVRNNDWWGKSPFIDTILVRIYEDNDKARAAFQTGSIDLVDTEVVFTNIYEQEPDVRLYRYLTSKYDFLAFNLRSPLFSDAKVRKALAYAIDRKEIMSMVFLNNGQAVDVPINPSSWLYDSSYRIYDYDPEKAVFMLKEAGWSDSDGDGILDKDIGGEKVNFKFTIKTNEDNDERRETALLIKRQLGEIGIQVDVEPVPWQEIQGDHIPKGSFDAILMGYYLSVFPDLEFILHSSGEQNFIKYTHPELDGLIFQSKTIYNEEELKDAYRQMQKLISIEMPIMSLYFRTACLVTKDKIGGIGIPRELDIYGGIEEWYIKR
ncbi:ABC transporter substrate-binding protein [Xylanivirga thermophila]|uniref:ABC transporter substrate-binding protein n=1 Tax=Xylanivirga thermophila TaxID=2496273 RepID=UPI00101B63E1|nr:ABC transporter substrate-binding protein [Xylanivirga thermophila]